MIATGSAQGQLPLPFSYSIHCRLVVFDVLKEKNVGYVFEVAHSPFVEQMVCGTRSHGHLVLLFQTPKGLFDTLAGHKVVLTICNYSRT